MCLPSVCVKLLHVIRFLRLYLHINESKTGDSEGLAMLKVNGPVGYSQTLKLSFGVRLNSLKYPNCQTFGPVLAVTS